MKRQQWIFLSSHFDDVALSCGGLVWELAQQDKDVKIWTIMGGFPPDEDYSDFARQNHRAWGMSGEEAIRVRQAEDRAACEVLGAQLRHFNWLDVIYRRDSTKGGPIVNNNDELFGKSPQSKFIVEITRMLHAEVPADAILVAPMGLGNHIDHQAVFLAGEQIGSVEIYYADYPYILNRFDEPGFKEGVWEKLPYTPSRDSLRAWQKAVLCYTSQWGAFWRDDQEARLALQNYAAGGGGCLWRKPVS